MTKMIKIALLAVVTAFTTFTFAYADFTLSEWEYVRPITVPTNMVVGAYVRMNIDREVSAVSPSNLADLRIISGDGEEVPYQLVVESESTRNAYVSSALRDRSSANGETMFILDLGQNRSVHDHLTIATESKNFKRPVSVYASDENLSHGDAAWRLMSGSNYIYNFYDQSLGFNVGKGDVFYPESTARYLRVVIGRGEGAEVAVGDVRVLRTLSREAKLNQTSEVAVLFLNTKEQSTELTVDLGASGIPTRSVSLTTSDTRNFNRRAVVEGSNDNVGWNRLGQGYVFQLDTPLFKGRSLSIPYSESLSRYVRVTVFNQDDQPVAWERSVSLTGVARSLVFQFDVGQSYTLYVGNRNATAARYDMAHFFEYIETAALASASMQQLAKNPSYIAPKPKEIPYTERNAYVLNAVLVLLVAVITFFMIAYFRKFKKSTPNS